MPTSAGLLPLTCLAPDIVEAILDGRQPKGLRLAEMLGTGRWRGKSSERSPASYEHSDPLSPVSTFIIALGRSAIRLQRVSAPTMRV